MVYVTCNFTDLTRNTQGQTLLNKVYVTKRGVVHSYKSILLRAVMYQDKQSVKMWNCTRDVLVFLERVGAELCTDMA